MMVVFSLFPAGILQLHDVITNGYWHARSLAYTAGAVPRLLEWLRMPGDLVFIFLGALPMRSPCAWATSTCGRGALRPRRYGRLWLSEPRPRIAG
jgi:nitric oxide reductase subunit B